MMLLFIFNVSLSIWLMCQPKQQGRALPLNYKTQDYVGGVLCCAWILFIIVGMVG